MVQVGAESAENIKLKRTEISELLLVARHAPLALFEHGVDGLAHLWASLCHIVDGQVVEAASVLDVGQGCVKILELAVNLGNRLLSVLNSLFLESFDGLDLGREVVVGWLEAGESLLEVADNSLVLENALVVAEVDLQR